MRYVIDKTEVPDKFINLYGTTILNYDVCFVCENCGSELYWNLPYPYTSSLDGRKSKYEEEENALRRIASEKLLAAHESNVCPICGAKLMREKGYYIPNKHSHKQVPQGDKWYDGYKPSWKYGDADDQFTLLARVRESMEQEQIDSAVATYLQICDSYVAPVTSGKSTEIQQNCESLKTYLDVSF